MKHKIIYIGCDYAGESALRAILNSPLMSEIEIVGVITHTFQKGKNRVVSLVKELGIPLFEESPNSEEGLAWIESLNPDFAVMLEYPKKLSKVFIDKFDWMINAHPSDLPKLRGGAPIEGTILNQEPLVISVHRVDEKFDHGECFHKTEPFDVAGMHFYQVYELCAKLASNALLKVIEQMLKGTQKAIPRNGEKASYLWYKNLKPLFTIKWNESDIHEIERQILAAGPKRGASTQVLIGEKQSPVSFLSGRAISYPHSEKPGKLKSIEGKTLCIYAKGGYLLIDEHSSELDIDHLSILFQEIVS